MRTEGPPIATAPDKAREPMPRPADPGAPGTRPSPLGFLAASAAASRAAEPETPAEIDIRELSAWYGTFQALHSITLRILRNRVTALIGPSGCGKSTLLRWMNR